MKQKLLMLLLLGVAISQWTFAQTRTVKGLVKGADDGLPIPGATVKISGTNRGVQTGGDGMYSIDVPVTGSLEFSFIGYTTKIVPVGTSGVLNVDLSVDTRQLSEVVVTAFGVERQNKALGYSVAQVGGDKLSQKSENDALRSLSGKVAGVNVTASSGVPGSSTNFVIRGNTSFLGNNQALLVVDGIPFNNTTTQSATSALVSGNGVSNRAVDLDPNNIETITVLKGAAAAAQYGSRAANGVVLITTKTGKSGLSKQGFEVSLNSSYSVEQIAGLPEYQNKYGAGTEFAYTNANGSFGPAFGEPSKFPQGNGVTNGTVPHWYAGNAALPQFPAGTTTPFEAARNNVKDFFETGSLVENSVAISSGGEKGSFSSVLSKSTQNGIIPNSTFDRNSLNVGGQIKLANKINVTGTLSYVNSKQNGPQLGAQNAVGQASAFARTLYFARNWDLGNFARMPYQNPATLGQVFPVTGVDNPYWSVENNTYKSNVERAFGNVGFDYDINSWINVNYKVGFNSYSDRRKQTIRRGSVGASGIGQVIDDALNEKEFESTLLLNFSKQLLPDLALRATLGNNINQRQSDRQAVIGSNMVVFDIDDVDNASSVLPFGGDYSKRRLIGAFADLQFDYKSFLYLTATGRNDWSSTLPVENRSFFYPAVSTSFVFSELMGGDKSLLSLGKVRASWAKVGKDAAPYSLNSVFSVNPTLGNNASGIVFPYIGVSGGTLGNQLADPNLTPEFTTEFEFGTELRFFNDRIGIDAAYYEKSSKNQIAGITVPSSTGFTTRLTNFGELSNKGIEVTLDAEVFSAKSPFNWNIFTTFSRNKSEVVSLTNGLDQILINAGFGDPQLVLRPGLPFGTIVGSKAARDADGNYLINRATGVFLKQPNQVLGDPNAKFNLALTNSFRFKGFNLSVLTDYKHGGSLFSSTVQQYISRGVTRDTEDRETMKVIPGFYGAANTTGGFDAVLDGSGKKIQNGTLITPNQFYFGTGSATDITEFAVFDASVFRLREVTLAYDIPKKWLGNSPIGSLTMSLTGRNLWYYAPNFPKYSNFDPETATFGAGNSQGLEYTNAPNTKRFGFNLRATF